MRWVVYPQFLQFSPLDAAGVRERLLSLRGVLREAQHYRFVAGERSFLRELWHVRTVRKTSLDSHATVPHHRG